MGVQEVLFVAKFAKTRIGDLEYPYYEAPADSKEPTNIDDYL